MDRKDFIKGAVFSAGALGVLQACGSEQQTATTSNIKTGLIVHSVYFWLKEGINEQEEQDFLNFFDILAGIPAVEHLSFGKPAPTNPRDVVDNSFSYHLIVFFKSMDDINSYETHPDHIAGAEQYSKYWTRVEVRDTIISQLL